MSTEVDGDTVAELSTQLKRIGSSRYVIQLYGNTIRLL